MPKHDLFSYVYVYIYICIRRYASFSKYWPSGTSYKEMMRVLFSDRDASEKRANIRLRVSQIGFRVLNLQYAVHNHAHILRNPCQ